MLLHLQHRPVATNAKLWPLPDQGAADPDDVRLALMLQDIELSLDGMCILPRDVLVRIFSILSPVYKSTSGRWLFDPVGCKYEV